MTDVLTPTKKLTQQGIGSHANDWGNILNTTIGYIDTALGGTLTKNLTGNVTLNASEVRNTCYQFNGSLSEMAIITFSSYYGMAVLQNNTNVTISCGISGGQTVNVPTTYACAIWSDGTDFKGLTDVVDKLAVVAPVSHTASSGNDTLPSKPAGFLMVNIQGLFYKVPYYGM